MINTFYTMLTVSGKFLNVRMTLLNNLVMKMSIFEKFYRYIYKKKKTFQDIILNVFHQLYMYKLYKYISNSVFFSKYE